MCIKNVLLSYLNDFVLDLTACITLSPGIGCTTSVESLSTSDFVFLIDFSPLAGKTNALDVDVG